MKDRHFPTRLLLPLGLALLAGLSFSPRALTGQGEGRATAGVAEVVPAIPGPLRRAMLADRSEEALRLLDGYSREQPGEHSTWSYLRGVVLAKAGRLAEAEQDFRELVAADPTGPWAAKARFQRAELLSDMGRVAEAEQIWEEEARRLRAPERQHELATIYLERADALSGESEVGSEFGNAKLDYPRAYVLYRKVLDLAAPPPDRDRALYRMGWCLRKQKKWREAQAAFRSFLDEAEENSALRWEARYQLGACLANGGNENTARQVFEDLLADRDCPKEMKGKAAFAIGLTLHERPEEAVAAFQRFLEDYPDHARAPEAAFEIGKRWRAARRSEEALKAFEAFLSHPQWPGEDPTLRPRALFLAGDELKAMKRYEEASAHFLEYGKEYPSGADWAAAQSAVVDCAWLAATDAQERGLWPQARDGLEDFVQEYPLDPRVLEAALLLGDVDRDQARSSSTEESRRAELFQHALRVWEQVVQRYPDRDEASRALLRIAELQEEDLMDVRAAAATYQRCDFGPAAQLARERLAAMREPYLRIETPRKWRDDEVASFELHTRNFPKVQVEIYPLDLESFFRKHRGQEGVEGLDLDLIDPARSFEFMIDGYEDFRSFVTRVPLPVEGPGAWAVAVRAGELRATTLVLRSDLDLILKTSRKELFVFTEDMRAGTPAAGVKLFFAVPGLDDLQEATSGPDGVARLALPELADASRVAVLARRGGDSASSDLSLLGLEAPRGLAPRAYVYTDRSAYRPAQSVHWKAIPRIVENASYAFEKGKEYTIRLIDSEGRVLGSQRLACNDFGTLSGDFLLDPAAPQGRYTLLLHGEGAPDASGHFIVDDRPLPRVLLAIQPRREVVFRGEEVEVEVAARFTWGEPLSGARILFTTPENRRLEGRSDDEGRALFRFPTRTMTREGELRFLVQLPDEGVDGEGSVRLARYGFSIGVSLDREEVLAGDSFGVEIRTRTPDGKAVARDLSMEVIRYRESRDPQRRGRIEQVVLEREFRTSDRDGGASLSLDLKEGGDYALRIHGSDRRGTPVVAREEFRVSGKDDPVALHLLADDLDLRVGGTARLVIHDRGGSGLALLTIEGGGILGYRLIHLQTGKNSLEIPVGNELFPAFTASVSFMDGHVFRSARSDFQVRRNLHVELVSAREDYAPGEEVLLEVHIRDQNGKPVRAEFSLAVSDESLYALYPDRSLDPASFFARGAQREGGVRTSSSCGFHYSGVTITVAATVLAEEERAARQRSWEKDKQALRKELQERSKAAPNSPALRIAAKKLANSDELEEPLEEEAFDAQGWNEESGLGGGAAGGFGGRARGGRKGSQTSSDRGRVESAGVYWTPAVVSDGEGRATLRFRLPRRSGSWRVVARAVGPGTTLGAGRRMLRTISSFQVELRAPAHLVAGDHPHFLARVHVPSAARGKVELRLRLGAGRQQLVLPATLTLDGSSLIEKDFLVDQELPLTSDGLLHVELEGAARIGGEELGDQVERTIPITPWGVEVSDSASGVLHDRALLNLSLPDLDPASIPVLELDLGVNVSQTLVESALGGGPEVLRDGIWFPAPALESASELYGVSAVMALMEQSGGGASYPLLRARASSLTARLVLLQGKDGGWRWGSGSTGRISIETTARALLALSRARQRGVEVSAAVLERGIEQLNQFLHSGESVDTERRAAVLHALSVAGRGDFAALNRLHRLREQLSPAALAYTALALSELDRRAMAADLARSLEARIAAAQGLCPVDSNGAWNRSPLENTALALLALERALPQSPQIAVAASWLEEQRPWYPLRARGLVLAALALHQGEWATARRSCRVKLRIAGKDSQPLELGPGSPHRRIRRELPAGTREVQVELQLEGVGAPAYSANLHAYSSKVEARPDPEFELSSYRFLAAAPRYLGKELPTGFSSLVEPRGEWENEIHSLPLGEQARVRVRWRRTAPVPGGPVPEEYLLLEVPFPGGCELAEQRVEGVASWAPVPGGLRCWLDPRRFAGELVFTVVGAIPGDFRILPAVLRSTTERKRRALGQPAELTILGRGHASAEPYRPTPDELLARGRRAYAAGDEKVAQEALQTLEKEFGERLRPDASGDLHSILLFLALDADDAPAIVRHFEILKEGQSSTTLSFARIRGVGRAYRRLEEYERATQIFRATVEQTFGMDLKVVGTLEEEGDFAAATKTLATLVRAYPDLPVVLSSELSLAEELLRKAPEAAADPSLRKARRGRTELTREGIVLLDRFLALHGEQPNAPDAALDLLSAYLDLEDFSMTEEVAAEMAACFRSPRYLDAFRYTQAYAEWYQGRDDEAEALLKEIAAARYPDSAGKERPSVNHDLALYILGQIHHAKRDLSAADAYYQQVANSIPDAAAALQLLHAKELELDEVNRFRPGEAVRVQVRHRNVERAELLAYRVDLLTLYLRERNLSRISEVDLAGIEPTLRVPLELGKDQDLAKSSSVVDLDLKDPGAYLLMVLGAGHHASGLILISDLGLRVHTGSGDGVVRAEVYDLNSGSLLRGVDVRVVGSGDARIRRGKSDPRGLFVARTSGLPTVIARLGGDRYAFFRGRQPVAGPSPSAPTQGRPEAEGFQLGSDYYLRNVRVLKRENSQRRQRAFQKELGKKRQGVPIDRIE